MFQGRSLVLGGFLFASLILAYPAAARAAATIDTQPIERVSAGADEQGGGGSYAAVSADGRYIVFESAASDLVSEHINGSWDVYIRDHQQSITHIASTRSGGQAVFNPADYTSAPAVSASGRYVAFLSLAEDLTSHTPNGMPDIYLHDRESQTTELISVALDGQAGNGPSFQPALSADGRYVAFQSLSNNLVEADQNDAIDIFVRDRQQGVTELVSVTDTGEQGFDPHEYGYSSVSISADGRFVAFSYQNLPAGSAFSGGDAVVYLRDRQEQTTRAISRGVLPALSADGQHLAFFSPDALTPDDKNDGTDLYVFHRGGAGFERVSSPVDPEAALGDLANSPPSLSANGRRIAFATLAPFVPADDNASSDVYVLDQLDGAVALVSQNAAGEPGDLGSYFPALAADGSAVAFVSLATNLVNDDVNQRSDVFLVALAPPAAGPVDLNTRLFVPFLIRP